MIEGVLSAFRLSIIAPLLRQTRLHGQGDELVVPERANYAHRALRGCRRPDQNNHALSALLRGRLIFILDVYNDLMRNAEIPKIRDMILETLGDTCEKIILFGSYAYGTPREESDIDIYVVLKDGTKKPILWLQDIYNVLGDMENYKPIDVLANYKSRFEYRSTGPTIERTIANKGVVLYVR